MSEEEYEKYKENHELLPKWGNVVAHFLNTKPTDSTATQVARFAGMVASPPVVIPGTLGAYAYDEIMYSPFTPFLGMPGRAQYAASKYLTGPKPAFLPSPDKFRSPSRPVQYNFIPKRASPAPLPFRPAPRVSAPLTLPAVSLPRLRPFGGGLSNMPAGPTGFVGKMQPFKLRPAQNISTPFNVRLMRPPVKTNPFGLSVMGRPAGNQFGVHIPVPTLRLRPI